MTTRFWFLVAMIGGAALMRILPHPPNVTPVAAMALFGGACFRSRRWAFAVPLAAMLASDLALELLFGWGFHALMPVVYASFAAIVGIGLGLHGARRSPDRIGAASVTGSTLFFLTTNFAVWALGSFYPPTAAGLLACYLAALPFYALAVVGDLAFAALLFGGLAAAEERFPVLARPGATR